mmetsp:Transcript_7398/g.12482  ORF Transcript_7398/g.12482 Transcript_7398/m.12482 type:complete len:578 (-) Transcript_7398:72-1805(-)
MSANSQFKSRDDQRRARELEEARKAGTIPAEKDEEGNEINPHIPQYMAQAPWYLNQDAPGLKHQRNLKDRGPVATVTDFIPRGQKVGPAASTFRKGACKNCGAMTHTAKDCVERPRKKGAKYTGKDIKADELIVEMAYDYAGKRDHYAQYDASNHLELIKADNRIVEERLKAVQKEKIGKLAAKEQAKTLKKRQKRKKQKSKQKDGAESESGTDTDADTDADTDTDTDTDGEGDSDDAKEAESAAADLGQKLGMNRNSGTAKMSVRNLRIREDTAKYLLNLDVSSAYYDPKTRSMRENPLPGTNPNEEVFAGDNFVRATGDASKLADLQLYQFEAYDKGQNLHLNADPTTVEMMNKIYRDKKANLKSSKANKILEKYGGQQHMEAPPAELVFAQTEQYVEYDRSGSVVTGQEKAVVKSKYAEDIFSHNHTAIWGSFFDRNNFRWGYADDHSTVQNSYSTGESGKRARELAAAAVSQSVEQQPEDAATLSAATSNAVMEQRSLFGSGESLGETKLDESKVRAAVAAEKANANSVVMDERKRKYNSMTADETTAEGMEAYYRNKARADDPMANFSQDGL